MSPEPRLLDGLNVYTHIGGGIRKRPGFSWDGEGSLTPTADLRKIAWVKQIANEVKIISSLNATTGFYEITAYQTASVTTTPSLRDIDKSAYPHEMVEVAGKAYIKGFPASGDKYCSVIISLESGSLVVRPWGAVPPSTPARITASVTKLNGAITSGAGSLVVAANYGSMPATPFTIYIDDEELTVTGVAGTTWTVTRGVNGTTAAAHGDKALVVYKPWNASAHQVDVVAGWGYSYAYKSITGQISSRAPFETNPDNAPSFTGRFRDKKPSIVVQGLADTTNYPKILIYRTTDGGGTPYFLEEIANTGAGSITYVDKSLTSGAGLEDPLPDDILDRNDFAPTLTSNSPPIPVIAPKVIGTDQPQQSSPLAYYAQRIWYAIENVLTCSQNEELEQGVPEESFDSSNLGPFFKFRDNVINLASTPDALLIFTETRTYVIKGNSRETFEPDILYEQVGARANTRRAIANIKDKVAFVTSTNRIGMTQGTEGPEPLYISEPLGDTLDFLPTSLNNPDQPCELHYYANGQQEWLILHTHNSALSRPQQYIYDIGLSRSEKKHFWHPPWEICQGFLPSNQLPVVTSVMWVSPAGLSQPVVPPLNIVVRATGVAGYNMRHKIALPESSGNTVNKGIDAVFNGLSLVGEYLQYAWHFTPGLHRLPAGNHVNALREPTLAPNVAYIEISYEDSSFTGTDFPSVFAYRNGLPSRVTPESLNVTNDPPRSPMPVGYRSVQYQLNRVANYITFRCGAVSGNLVNVYAYSIAFDPGGGDG